MTTLVPLTCPGCGGGVPLEDENETSCPYCGARVIIPATHREALRLTQSARDGLKLAEASWRRYRRVTLSRRFSSVVAILPAIGVIAGMALAFVAVVAGLRLGVEPRVFLGLAVFIPLPFEMSAALYVYFLSLTTSKSSPSALAAARGGETVTCRGCSAPLTLRADDAFVRCAYCGTDSLASPDAVRERALRGVIDTAHRTLEDALESIRDRSAEARGKARVVGLICGGLSLLPLVWCFGPASWTRTAFGPAIVPWAVFAEIMFALGFPVAFRVAWAEEIEIDSPQETRAKAADDMGVPLLVAGLVSLLPTALFIFIAIKAHG